MDFWTYPTLFSTLRDKLPPELRDPAAFHSNAMKDMVARGDQGELDGLPDHESAKFGLEVPRPLITDCVRLCATLCLLADDPEIIEADVLSKDRQKYFATFDEKYVEKAHRRGKVGWLVGRDLEMTPGNELLDGEQ